MRATPCCFRAAGALGAGVNERATDRGRADARPRNRGGRPTTGARPTLGLVLDQRPLVVHELVAAVHAVLVLRVVVPLRAEHEVSAEIGVVVEGLDGTGRALGVEG